MSHRLQAVLVAAALLPAGESGLANAADTRARHGPGAAVEVVEKTIPELQAAMQSGAVTSRRLVELYLARIEAYDRRGPRLQAMISLNPRALETADALDRERAERGPRGPLHGIPIVVKDNFDTADMPTTAGSLALAALRPAEDAFQVRKLREAGAVILGKTNLHELASGITTISSLGGQTRNPYDPSRNPGGSSGGTGAAVAASFAAAGMGSDTCGSIRIPAAHNALVGLRPSFGLASRSGVIPLSHTQDVAGPLARSVTELAIMLDATVGPDPADPTTKLSEGHIPRSYRDALGGDGLEGARIGILTSLFGTAPEDDEVARVVRKAIDEMQKAGAETLEVAIPGLDDLLRDSAVIDAEFKFDLADYLARFPNPPVRSLGDILERGLYDAALETSFRRRNAVEQRESESYRKALVKRRATLEAVLAALEEHRLTAIAYPTIRRKPSAVGETQRGTNCQLSATTGLPALSVPAGFTDDGLPVGVELLGPAFSEPELLRLAFAHEQASRHRRPPATTPPLVRGSAPAPIAFEAVATAGSETPPAASSAGLRGRFRFDLTTGALEYSVTASGVSPQDVLAASIHRGAPGKSGAAVVRVLGPRETAGSGTLTLSARDRAELQAGALYMRLYTRSRPAGAARAQLAPPGAGR
jgi:Asp-tRNA(Asn)/Glu-tRNA(Gln) amidotransferase A subunit family amidase